MASGLPQNRGAVRRVVVLAGAIVAIVLAGAVALLLYAASSVDRVQAAEERALVAGYLARHQADVVRDLRSVTIWDEAYEKVALPLDVEWSDTNIGSYYANYFGHSLSVVLDGRDAPVYVWRGKGRGSPAAAAAFLRGAAPLVASVRAAEAARDPRASRRDFAGSLAASGLVRADGGYYLVGVTDVVPETAATPLRPGPAVLVLSARRLDAAFLDHLEADLRLSDAHMVARAAPGEAVLPIRDLEGAVSALLAWTPKRPGVAVIQEAIPLFVAVLAMLVAAGVGLAFWVRTIFRELRAGESALLRAMDELVEARDQAAAASVAKSQFLANMSHEIRTPLNGILGMAQIMGRDDLSARQRERLEVVRESGGALLTVLNDILDISKIEAGKLEIDNHEFDMAAAVQAACAPFAGMAGQKDVAFRVDIEPEAEGLWFGDGMRLRQILANLASNAVKFTSEGEVAVLVGRVGSAVRIVVRDTGIGIPQERLGDLFDKFLQVDASASRRFGGTGLGLAISRELAVLMGGAMTVDSREGEGSTFAVLLPLERRGAAPASTVPIAADRKQSPQAEAPLRVLAAEDNPTNQLVLAAMLEPLGLDLTLADDGAQALAAFASGGFDLILMDVQMPVMNGVEATAAIRGLEAERGLPPTPILALSANVMSHQVAEYLAAGMDGFVPKPIEAARLIAAIDAALTPSAEPIRRSA